MRHRAIERRDPTDKLRFWDADRKFGRDQRGIEIERTLGDKCGFKRLCDTMVVTTEACMVIGRIDGAMLMDD